MADNDQIVLTVAEVLANRPPGTAYDVSDLTSTTSYAMAAPEIKIFCGDTDCNGLRYFRGTIDTFSNLEADASVPRVMTYACKNCNKSHKRYAVLARRNNDRGNGGLLLKFGEWPPFGPPTPAVLTSLIGPDRDSYLKGRRCEGQGLGIGAFAYYRRVVENQRDRLLDEIINVVRRTSNDVGLLRELELAKAQTQFTTSIESIKRALPDVLRIDGHNPLTLLHDALSEGLHKLGDEECMDRAQIIRVVLTELAARTKHVLKEHSELTKAVGKLTELKGNKD